MKFEYYVFKTDFTDELEDDLKESGKNGWELVSICPYEIHPILGGGEDIPNLGQMPSYLNNLKITAVVTMKRQLSS